MADRKKLTPRQKLALIRLVEEGKESVTSICSRYGVSRKTFYKWRQRYYIAREQKQPPLSALSPKKRTYHRKKPRPTDKLVPEVTETVKKDPTLSAHGIAKLLRISSKGVWGVLKRLGLSREKQRKEFKAQYIPQRSLPPRKKLALIQLVESGELSVSQACQRYGISRKTFFLNMGRIVFSILAIVYVNQVFAYVLHDYLMVLVTILWLFAFWWFSYSFVLETKEQGS